MRLGFACVWDQDPRRTWSYTPWDLREALHRRSDVDVVDVGFEIPKSLRRVLQVASLKRRAGRWVTPWEHLRIWESGIEFELNRRASARRCDAVLQIQDLGVTSTPFLIYQDFSYDVILDSLRQQSLGLREYFPHLDLKSVQRRRRRQLRVYESASRVLTMSDFLRQSLIHTTGLDRDKVVTIWPGLSTSAPPSLPNTGGGRRRPRRRLLFIGTTFLVKGGDLVLAAFALLRERYPDMVLTVVGPKTWPLAGTIPGSVRFLGRLDPARLADLYEQHDLLVVPSRLEGFGKVFVEAQSHGLPCIGRRAFAMPELIQPGVNGDLVQSDSPAELAVRIEGVLGNDLIFHNCEFARDEIRARFNWDRAASDIVAAARSALESRRG